MITVSFYGLDQFIVGDISSGATTALAKVYNVDEDEINFIANNTMVFHNGVEQTSWNVFVHVYAPYGAEEVQTEAAQALIDSLGENAIHTHFLFHYFKSEHALKNINPDYPLFIEDNNAVSMESSYEEGEMEEGEGDNQIFTGDIFKDFKKKDN